jgi:ubiquitin carboxyl-terminal hydrolase L3
MHSLGVDKKWKLVDVLSFDNAMLSMIDRSACALLVLFPLKDVIDSREAESTIVELDPSKYESNIFFMKQEGMEISSETIFFNYHACTLKTSPAQTENIVVSNACGTVAIVHAIANNRDKISLLEKSVLSEFVLKASSVALNERTSLLGDDERIEEVHEKTANKGKTKDSEMLRKDLHFLTLTLGADNRLYELDGRNPSPIDHGPSSSFIDDAARIVRDTLMAKANHSLMFSAMALVRDADDDDDDDDDVNDLYATQIAQIMEMGVENDRQKVFDALVCADGNAEAALSMLLDRID